MPALWDIPNKKRNVGDDVYRLHNAEDAPQGVNHAQ